MGLGRALRATVLISLLSSSACHTMYFEVAEGTPANVVEERRSFYFWGLTPTKNINVLDHCPAGAVAITDKETFLDGLFGALTLGIWAPRTSIYHCAAEGK